MLYSSTEKKIWHGGEIRAEELQNGSSSIFVNIFTIPNQKPRDIRFFLLDNILVWTKYMGCSCTLCYLQYRPNGDNTEEESNPDIVSPDMQPLSYVYS